VRVASTRTISPSCLLARPEGFLLIGGDQGFPFLHGLLADLPHLLPLLLRRERGTGADALNLRTGIAPHGENLFRHRLLNAGLLPARFASAVSRLRGRGWSRCSAECFAPTVCLRKEKEQQDRKVFLP
jgi:hypothetical protein